MPIEKIDIKHEDSATNIIHLYRKDNTNNKEIFLLLPALGVRASFYTILAEQFAKNVNDIALIDWRGNGDSSVRAKRGVNFYYENLLQDIKDVIDTLIKKGFEKVHIIGHSLGGQLGGVLMGRFPQIIHQVTGIASCNVDYRHFGNQKYKVLFAAYIINIISTIWGYYPGQIFGFGGREAKGLMQNWSKTAKTGNYNMPQAYHDDELLMSQCTNPIVFITLEGDDMAPSAPAKAFLNKFPNSKHLEFSKQNYGIPNLNHFSWVKRPEYLIQYFMKDEINISSY